MSFPDVTQETVYSGPAPEAQCEKVADVPPSELEPVEHLVHNFLASVFGWIAASLFISAFFASYSDQWDESSVSMLVGRSLFALTGGLFVLSFLISRKAAKMLPSVAAATLVAYAALQGILFGLSYRAVYDAPLAPVYLCISVLFGLLAAYGRLSGDDLTSIRSLVIGAVLAPGLAAMLKILLGMQTVAACAACACSWLMLALAGYHRQFLRDLPSTFENDFHWRKAAAVGALQICLDVVIIVLVVIQARWLRDFLQSDKEESLTSLRISAHRKN